MNNWKTRIKGKFRKAQLLLLLVFVTCAAAGCGSKQADMDSTGSTGQAGMSGAAVTPAQQPTPKTSQAPAPKPTPEKTKKFKADEFTLKIPVSWTDQYHTKESVGEGNDNVTYLDFYANKCHEETGMGLLFSIAAFKDESYKQLSSYVVVGKTETVSYVAVFPIRLQTVGASEEAKQQYDHMFGTIEKVANTLELKKKK